MGKYSEAQEMYWDVSLRYAMALDRLQRMSRIHSFALSMGMVVDAVVMAQIELDAARDAHDAFDKEHAGQTFRVFRPESIEAMRSDDIEPLDFKPFEEEER